MKLCGINVSDRSKVWILSDTHFGHRRILEFSGIRSEISGCGSDIDKHDQYIFDTYNSMVADDDCVIFLGDIAMHKEYVSRYVPMMKGNKILVRGNHDYESDDFYRVSGFMHVTTSMRLDRYILTHYPIHPLEFDWNPKIKANIHGHIHGNVIPDPRYVNMSLEALMMKPMRLTEVEALLVARGIL